MTEVRLRPDFPFTPEWYAERERAPHWEQPVHFERLSFAYLMAKNAVSEYGCNSIVDLGAGDGGLLARLQLRYKDAIPVWGYDISPAAVAGAVADRGVQVIHRDFVNDSIQWGDLAIITEVLEHLDNPHAMVRRIARNCKAVVASSPVSETLDDHDDCHVWAWDREGYANLFTKCGWEVTTHVTTGGDFQFQVLTAAHPKLIPEAER